MTLFAPASAVPDAESLAAFAAIEPSLAVAELRRLQLATPTTVALLAEAALAQAETDPAQSAHWLQVATALDHALGGDPLCQAQISYAQARIYVQQGELMSAEERIRQAQSLWQSVDDQAGFTRSLLGLGQILAMQGRYAEAEVAAGQAIANLEQARQATANLEQARQATGDANADLVLQIIRARQNLATVLIYQDKHEIALEQYEQARQLLQQVMNQRIVSTNLLAAEAGLELNRASALMFLDAFEPAETAMLRAIALYQHIDDTFWRGRARTNLGTLYMRTGRYAAALDEFSRAFGDLIGDQSVLADPDLPDLRRADVLLLDQAMAYVALNLLPEALLALERCERLFRSAEQPYELGQALYTAGLLQLRNGDWDNAAQRLTEAAQLFGELQNRFWLNRTTVARATLAYQQGHPTMALRWLSELPSAVASVLPAVDAPIWDLQGLVEANLLRLYIHVDAGEFAAAEACAQFIDQAIAAPANNQPDLSTSVAPPAFFAHLHQRLAHACGRLAYAAGHLDQAKQQLTLAIDLLEQQRASLPVEEIRTAFLDDKATVYADLIQVLLADPNPTVDLIAEAFALVERARSRALLERLWAAVDEAGSGNRQPTTSGTAHLADQDPPAPALANTRQQVHWFYNQLFRADGPHRLDAASRHRLQAQETVLQQMEWQVSPLQTQANPVDLPTFQQTLAADQQAIVYAIVHQEVLAFLVDRQRVRLFRHLCTKAEVEQAQAELRFQMGRVEMGAEHRQRHRTRLQARLDAVLLRLYQQLIAPLRPVLTAARLLLIPAGSLHLLPFHALWDGADYLVNHFECSYAPSASIALLRRQRQTDAAYTRFAGLALTDPAIPAAQQEVVQAAAYFAQTFLYFDEQAGRVGLQQAARQADILHIATHGLFRPDNPFFSALKLADGWIDVREIYRLPLAARLVVLSACESGATEIHSGDEVVGLARGFLGAGAQEMLVSLWNVHDASAAALMNRFYATLTAEGSLHRPAAALRIAQQQAIAAHQHPYYWAPYFVIGD